MTALVPMPPSLRKIMLEVCEQHRVKPEELAGESRLEKLVFARRAFVWRARKETKHSFPRIAAAIRKDHTSAVHHFYKVERGEAGVDPYVPPDSNKLRAREIEVVELRKAGVAWDVIAARFGVQEITVRSYASSAKRKLGERDE